MPSGAWVSCGPILLTVRPGEVHPDTEHWKSLKPSSKPDITVNLNVGAGNESRPIKVPPALPNAIHPLMSAVKVSPDDDVNTAVRHAMCLPVGPANCKTQPLSICSGGQEIAGATRGPGASG